MTTNSLESESTVKATTSHVYAVLLMTDTQGRTLERDLLRETTLIGSGKGCDVRLISDAIAAAHCLVSLNDGILKIRDLGSSAGTVVNGERVSVHSLADGDELQLGPHRLRIETNLPGQRFRGFYLDVYQVTEILGAGGMCWIYGARNSVTRERVALKMLPAEHSPRMLAHFGMEARAGLLLSHPNIARVEKLMQSESNYFLVMEYLEAITLQELVEIQGPLDWPLACHIARQIAAGLDQAHHRRIIHRDVKPSNILCLRQSDAKLIDFGLALVADDPHQQKLARAYGRQILGTADYISPEQSIHSYQLDGRADLYSLGCVLYFSVTGCVPFPVTGVKEKLRAHRLHPARDPGELATEIPAALTEVIQKLMAKEPSHRFSSGSDVAVALEPFAKPRTIAFDWAAVLSHRASDAQRRLSRLLARRQQMSAQQPLPPLVVGQASGDPEIHRRQVPQLTEVDYLQSLKVEAPDDSIERGDWAELSQLWTQMTASQRHDLIERARSITLAESTNSSTVTHSQP